MARKSTVDNIITLVTLRFIGQPIDSRKIAKFLGVSRRHAYTIIQELLRRGLLGKNNEVTGTTDKGLKVIANVMRYIADLIEER